MKILIAKIILSVASAAALAVIAYSAWNEIRKFWNDFTLKEAGPGILIMIILVAIVWSISVLAR